MKITAVIPARAGSRRLKNKNILPFANTNLLVHKIRQLKSVLDSEFLDRIIVSSNSDTILEMAINEGVDTHKREERFSDEISEPFGMVVKNIAQHIQSEHILWATCTCPLIESNHYIDAIKKYITYVPNTNDSLLSFEVIKRYLWDSNGPLNYQLGINHVPSQDLPDIYQPTFGICIAPRDKMIEWQYFHGKNPYKYIMNKINSVDIDDELDLECAKAYLNMHVK